MHNEATQSMSPDHILVDRLLQMRDGFAKVVPAEFLARQVALGEMTAKHATRLLDMIAAADAEEAETCQWHALGECDWCAQEVSMDHQCPFLADLP